MSLAQPLLWASSACIEKESLLFREVCLGANYDQEVTPARAEVVERRGGEGEGEPRLGKEHRQPGPCQPLELAPSIPI